MLIELKDFVKLKIENLDFKVAKLFSMFNDVPSEIRKNIENKFNNMNEVAIEEDGAVVLTNDKFQHLNAVNDSAITIQLPEDDCYSEEIHLFVDSTEALLTIYTRSIGGSNQWNESGWCSQYIPVTPSTSFTFKPETVTTGSVEMLQYNAIDNSRKTPVIGKNATVTLNSTTKYVRVNCWDANQAIPEYIMINGKKYLTSVTNVESEVATEFMGMPEILLPENCTYQEEIVFNEDEVQEIIFNKRGDNWICGKIEEEDTSLKVLKITKAEYELLEVKDENTLYVIVE